MSERVNTMTMKDFAAAVKRAMEEHFGDGYSIAVQEVTKNNGLNLTGMTIKDNRMNIAPTIYLDSFYGEFQKGEIVVAQVCDAIIRVYEQNKVASSFDVESITDFDRVKDRICYKLVNAEKNEELLKDAPHKRFHDLAIVYFILVSQDGSSTGTTLVRKDLQELWGVDAETLDALAHENTPRLFRGSVASMQSVIMNIIAGIPYEFDKVGSYDFEPVEPDADTMYIATNHQKNNGAGVILYDGLLKEVANRVGSDLYIIPSSVHEAILMPVSQELEGTNAPGLTPRDIKEMVREVNANEVSQEEILSDNAYYYSRVLDRVEMM